MGIFPVSDQALCGIYEVNRRRHSPEEHMQTYIDNNEAYYHKKSNTDVLDTCAGLE